jgi:hypothetical protein
MTPSKQTLWAGQLHTISKQPLAYCKNFPEIAARWEAWWQFKADRPVMTCRIPLRGDIYWGKGFHLLDRYDEWLATQLLQLENTHWMGDTPPHVRVDIGPEAPAAFLGAPLTISEAEQTAWNTPTIENWSPPPRFEFDPQNKWFRYVVDTLAKVAEDACGRYVVCLPDMGGAMDVLVNMRSPTLLCMDVMDAEREAVKTAAMQIAEAWGPMYEAALDAILPRGAGYINQMLCWSDFPYVVPTCDFNALIGPEDFVDLCLPSLERQARYAGRICFHLDGPQASRHATMLSQQSWVTSVQYTPGAGTPSALAKLDMFRELQAAGKPILTAVPVEELDEFCGRVDPRGVAIYVDGISTVAEADACMMIAEKHRACV